VVEIHHQRAGKKRWRDQLDIPGQTQRNEVAGIVSIDPAKAVTLVEICMDQTEPGKRHKVHAVGEAKMIQTHWSCLRLSRAKPGCEKYRKKVNRRTLERTAPAETVKLKPAMQAFRGDARGLSHRRRQGKGPLLTAEVVS
jgi:hypothetical protein